MNSEIAIKVDNLSKCYTLRHPIKDADGNDTYEHWALRDVSFEIKKGESVGIIGPNGSGKSTLLKILAGVTKPTSGKVTIKGKVASILDIGAGFHPELSGRENVYLNGQIHGFTKKEVESKFDEIVAFSGIEKFIDEPVKNYSNGMYLRLAFSIMVHLDFDVYLFDEVLSVGDAEFREKSKNAFLKLSKKGKTFIIVSHQLLDIESNDLYLILNKGKLKKITPNFNNLSNYLAESLNYPNANLFIHNVTLDDFQNKNTYADIKLKSVALTQNSEEFMTNKAFDIKILYEKTNKTDTWDLLLVIRNENGSSVFSSSPIVEGNFTKINENKLEEIKCQIPPNLFLSKPYSISILFMKNLLTSLSDDNISQIEENEFMSFNNILMFKPMYNTPLQDVNLSKINLQHDLFMALEWG